MTLDVGPGVCVGVMVGVEVGVGVGVPKNPVDTGLDVTLGAVSKYAMPELY